VFWDWAFKVAEVEMNLVAVWTVVGSHGKTLYWGPAPGKGRSREGWFCSLRPVDVCEKKAKPGRDWPEWWVEHMCGV
jgi:hypothetical protein